MSLVGVWPAAEARGRSRLLAAFAALTGAQFEPVDDLPEARSDLGALIVLAAAETEALRRSLATPTIVFAGSPRPARVGPISFAESPEVDGRLSGQTLLGNWSPMPTA